MRFDDHTGKSFGYWTAIRIAKKMTVDGGAFWVCVCICGVEREVRAAQLVRGRSNSCGCMKSFLGSKNSRSSKKKIKWERMGDCLVCTSHSPGNHGYPTIRSGGKLRTIARTILLKRHPTSSSGIVSRHTCDNKLCIRPDHIIPGTRADNTQDAVDRGRIKKGEEKRSSKLTDAAVRDIRSFRESAAELVRKYGVCESSISQVRTGKIWRHVV